MSIEKTADGKYRMTCPNPQCPRKGAPWISRTAQPARSCPTCNCRRLDGRTDGRYAKATGPDAFEWIESKMFSCGHTLPLRTSKGIDVCPECVAPPAVQNLDSKAARRFACQTPGCPRQGKMCLLNKGKRTRICKACNTAFGYTEDQSAPTWKHIRLKQFSDCQHIATAKECKAANGCPQCKGMATTIKALKAATPAPVQARSAKEAEIKIDLPKPRKVRPVEDE
jgi:hypothetical protein